MGASERYQAKLDELSLRVHNELEQKYDGLAPKLHDVMDRTYNWFDFTYSFKEYLKAAGGHGILEEHDTYSIFINMEPLLLKCYARRLGVS